MNRAAVQYPLVAILALACVLWRLGLCPLDEHECNVAVPARSMADRDHWIDPQAVAPPLPANTTFNHWMVPLLDGEPRLQKTPLAYWCVAGFYLAGLPQDEFTTRLPSALSLVLVALIVLALGRKMFTPRVALIAALLFITMTGAQDQARKMRVDMLLTLWTTATMACFYFGLNASRAGVGQPPCGTGGGTPPVAPSGSTGGGACATLWLLAGWFAAGLGNLAKEFVPVLLALPLAGYLAWRGSTATDPGDVDGPRRKLITWIVASVIGLVIYTAVQCVGPLAWWSAIGVSGRVGIAVTMLVTLGLPLLWYFRSAKAWGELKPVLPTLVPGAAVMLFMVLGWFWYVGQLFPRSEGVLSLEIAERVTGGRRWQNPGIPGFYLFSVIFLTLPWLFLLPGAVFPFMRRFAKDRGPLVFNVLWAFGFVLLCSTLLYKRNHYMIPVLPPMALLMAYCADDLFFGRKWWTEKATKVTVRVAAVVSIGAAAAGLVWLVLAMFRNSDNVMKVGHLWAIAVAACALVGLAAGSVRKGKAAMALGAVLAAAMVAELAYFTRADLWSARWESKQVAERAKSAVAGGGRVAIWGIIDAQVVFYFGQDIPSATRHRSYLVRLHGKDEGERLWKEWLYDRKQPLYLVAHGGIVMDELKPLGFVLADQKGRPRPRLRDAAFYRLDESKLTRQPPPGPE